MLRVLRVHCTETITEQRATGQAWPGPEGCSGARDGKAKAPRAAATTRSRRHRLLGCRGLHRRHLVQLCVADQLLVHLQAGIDWVGAWGLGRSDAGHGAGSAGAWAGVRSRGLCWRAALPGCRRSHLGDGGVRVHVELEVAQREAHVHGVGELVDVVGAVQAHHVHADDLGGEGQGGQTAGGRMSAHGNGCHPPTVSPAFLELAVACTM